MKAKIFIQRLEEGQNCFLDEFLMPEIESICDTMGFRDIPEVGFRKIDLQDEAVLARIYAQLAQIGVLTAEQTVKAIETGIMPDEYEMESGQEAYKKARDKGLYEPLVGGQKDDGSGPNGRPGGSGGGKQAGPRRTSPIGTSRAFSMSAIADHVKAAQELETEVVKAFCKRARVTTLNEDQTEIARSMVQRIVSLEPMARWNKVIKATFEKPQRIPPELAAELEQISLSYDVSDFEAALLRHCITESPADPV